MTDAIGSNYSYRDKFTSSALSGSGSTSETQVWNAVFTDKSSNSVSMDDFLSLMVAQLTNQDFMNPVDDTQYITQLAQFSSMQAMQEMGTYMKSNYVMSLIGKNVTAAKINVSGALQKETGIVEKISLVDNEFAIYVNGTQFSLEQVMEINASAQTGSSEKTESDPATSEYLLSLVGRTVTVRQRDEDGEAAGKLTGIVEKVTDRDGSQLYVDGDWYPLDDLLEAAGMAEQDEVIVTVVDDADAAAQRAAEEAVEETVEETAQELAGQKAAEDASENL